MRFAVALATTWPPASSARLSTSTSVHRHPTAASNGPGFSLLLQRPHLHHFNAQRRAYASPRRRQRQRPCARQLHTPNSDIQFSIPTPSIQHPALRPPSVQ
eukprot:726620-Pyramimonas_sp.AAC.1